MERTGGRIGTRGFTGRYVTFVYQAFARDINQASR
ncbi:MAG: hypothetical protein JWM50_2362 [Microbacteriaceae bacterium]|nr:hypothetical protein [Microbacteriaceae bacterium]